MSEEIKETPTGELEQGEFKIKKKPKKLANKKPQETTKEIYLKKKKKMPFQSQAQRRWMYANFPKMAAKWEKHTSKSRKLPKRKKKKQ